MWNHTKKEIMERGKPIVERTPDAILTADWHIREDQPVCRTDVFWDTQWKKIDFIASLQRQYQCPIIHAGDLFDHWKPSPMLLSKTMQHIPDDFYTIYGNHDLPQHNLELAYKTGIHVLERAGFLRVIKESENFDKFCMYGAHWLQEVPVTALESQYSKIPTILVWHTMTWQGKEPWHGCADPASKQLLKKHSEYNLILTGHNHKTFIETHEGRVLLNPGSIFRANADQDEHQPCVWLWYTDSNTVEPVYIPTTDCISRTHLEVKQERDNRIEAFINTLNTDWTPELSFEQNMEVFRKANNVPEEVMQLVYESINR